MSTGYLILYYKKRVSIMEKGTKIMVWIWAILALISFVGSWFTPLWFFKVCGWAFGGLNIMIGLSWLIATIQGKIEARKAIEHTDEIIKLAEEQLAEINKPKRGRPKKEKGVE